MHIFLGFLSMTSPQRPSPGGEGRVLAMNYGTQGDAPARGQEPLGLVLAPNTSLTPVSVRLYHEKEKRNTLKKATSVS